jgi:hypothetical protein
MPGGGIQAVSSDPEYQLLFLHFQAGDIYGYFFGELTYADAVTGKERKYDVELQVKVIPNTGNVYANYIVNDNKNVSPKGELQ